MTNGKNENWISMRETAREVESKLNIGAVHVQFAHMNESANELQKISTPKKTISTRDIRDDVLASHNPVRGNE